MDANEGRFKLRDLLSVPMQRVLKYHLLLRVSYSFLNLEVLVKRYIGKDEGLFHRRQASS